MQVRSLKGHAARVSALSWNRTTLSSGGRDSLILNHDVRCPSPLLFPTTHCMRCAGFRLDLGACFGRCPQNPTRKNSPIPNCDDVSKNLHWNRQKGTALCRQARGKWTKFLPGVCHHQHLQSAVMKPRRVCKGRGGGGGTLWPLHHQEQ